MKQMLAVMSVMGIVSCERSPVVPDDEPAIRGVIQGPGDVGSLVVVAAGHASSCDTKRRLQIQVGSAKIRRRSGGSASKSALTVGTPVSAWITGVVLDQCPGIAKASVIVIENL